MRYSAEQFSNDLIEAFLIRSAGGVLKLYHGTSDIKARKIKSEGLQGITYDASWYMLSSHIDDAIFHSETVMGNPVVIEFNIPYEDVKRKWKGFPYLWPPFKARGSFKGDWYAIKEAIPPKFIKRVMKITRKDFNRVKG